MATILIVDDVQTDKESKTATTADGIELGGVLRLAFLPAIAVVNRLTYARKFVLIGVVLLAPLAFLLRLQYRGTTESVDFSAKEIIGVHHIHPVKDLLHANEKIRVLAAASASTEVTKKLDITTSTNEADAKGAEIDAIDR